MAGILAFVESHPANGPKAGTQHIPILALRTSERVQLEMHWPDRIYRPERAQEVYESYLDGQLQRHMISVMLDAQGRIIAGERLSTDAHSITPEHYQEIMAAPYRQHAAAVVFVHTHVGEPIDPTLNDLYQTQGLIEEGKKIGVQVKDHLILSAFSRYFFSFAAHHLILAGLFGLAWSWSVIRDLLS